MSDTVKPNPEIRVENSVTEKEIPIINSETEQDAITKAWDFNPEKEQISDELTNAWDFDPLSTSETSTT